MYSGEAKSIAEFKKVRYNEIIEAFLQENKFRKISKVPQIFFSSKYKFKKCETLINVKLNALLKRNHCHRHQNIEAAYTKKTHQSDQLLATFVC